MKTWNVTLPITGRAIVEVEAETKEEAIDKAIEVYSLENIETWDVRRKIVEGNVFHGDLNEAEAFEVETD